MTVVPFSISSLSENCLQEVLRRNGTVKIFDRLRKRTHRNARQRQEDLASDHSLFEDYATPGPLQDKDLLGRAGITSDYQWLIATSHRQDLTNLLYQCSFSYSIGLFIGHALGPHR